MTRIFRYKKSASFLLVLVYLLVGSGFGNALLWCQDSEAFSHLEFNLAGKCQEVCQPAEGSHGIGGQTARPLFSWGAAADCEDTPVSLSHALAPSAKKLLADAVSPGWPTSHFLPFGNCSATSLTSLNLVAQPPPPQALALLRTVVLLN